MSRSRIASYTLTGIFILAAMGFAIAQGKTGTAQDNVPAGMAGITDGQFLQEALNYSSFQITMGEMAVRQAAGRDFKNYGRDMAAAHGQICRDLEKIAAKKGLKLSPDIDPVRRNTVSYYSREYGAAFDRNYIGLMIDENRRDARLYRYTAQNAADRDIREFAGRVAPDLEGYAKRAEKILTDLPFPVLK